jgi:hypothetical protein
MFEGGGDVPGVDTGEDKVPALLRSEELVVTPELTEMLEQVQTPEQAMQVVQMLQQLADKPLEFSDEAGEFIAQDGGTTGDSASVMGLIMQELQNRGVQIPGLTAPIGDATQIPGGIGNLIGAFPQTTTGIPHQDLDPLGGGPSVLEGPRQTGFPEPSVPENILGTPSRGGIDRSGTVPQLTLEGGTPGQGGLAELSGLQGRGTVSTLGVAPQKLTEEEQDAQDLQNAQRRADLIQSAMITDPVGGAQKAARMGSLLDMANNAVIRKTREILVKQQQKALQGQAQAAQLQAAAAVEDSISKRIEAEAAKTTAEAGLAKQIRESLAVNPQLQQIMPILDAISQVKDERSQQFLEATFRRIWFEQTGEQLTENGSLKRLLGAPEFEFVTPENEGEAAQELVEVAKAIGDQGLAAFGESMMGIPRNIDPNQPFTG